LQKIVASKFPARFFQNLLKRDTRFSETALQGSGAEIQFLRHFLDRGPLSGKQSL
jgi:hypothetical protein